MNPPSVCFHTPIRLLGLANEKLSADQVGGPRRRNSFISDSGLNQTSKMLPVIFNRVTTLLGGESL